MPEEYRGYTFSSGDEDGLPPLTLEEIDDARRQFDAFIATREATPPEEKVYIGEGDRFGGWDGWAGEEDEDYLRRREMEHKGELTEGEQ
ncbi:hypothetical protein KO481_32155 [Nocardia sp. NEAU-G5]|uniref:Uncharacterized protein n=1 Tax=Nocardia albiluteola TaxID=2842303 RepID=A0ABS6B7R0_9NOCA|nr:hypothetical protein [Nocardia albiluteola]MBU3066158.1 hypothetical protein [Nocardia albiluteola]